MDEDSTVKSSRQPRSVAFDAVSLVAALIFAAAGTVALAGESLSDIDPVVLAGAALIAVGAARFVAVPVRSLARRRAAAGPAQQHDEQDQTQDQDQSTGS